MGGLITADVITGGRRKPSALFAYGRGGAQGCGVAWLVTTRRKGAQGRGAA